MVQAYVDNNNMRVASKPHAQVTVNPIMVLPYEKAMDKEQTKFYDQANTKPDTAFAHSNTSPNTATIIYDIMTPDTAFAHSNTSPNTATIIYDIMTDNTSSMTTL